LFIAFAGGLLAMVTIARWQPGRSSVTNREPAVVTRALPEPEATESEPERDRREPEVVVESDQRPVVPADSGARAYTDSVAAHPVPISKAGQPNGQEPIGEGGEPFRGVSRDRGAAEPEARRPGDGTPDSPAGPIGRTSQKPGRSGQTPGARQVANAPQAIFGNPSQGDASDGRVAPRSAPAGAPAGNTESTTDSRIVPATPDVSTPDNTYDDPRDDSEDDGGGSQNIDPPDDSDPEPEVPTARVRMVPMLAAFNVDAAVPISVEIYSGNDVGHVPFHVNFDPRVLRFDRAEEGPFLGSDGVQTVFFAQASMAGDSVVVGLSRMGQAPGVDGAGQLCVLQFVAVGSGATTLGFSRAKVRDSTSDIIPANFEPVTLTVN
jgi:hypothetical protein